jgi:hypothetical protein
VSTGGVDVEFVIDPQKLAEFMRSPGGPVVRRMLEDGDLVVREAKRLVGYGRPDPLGRPRTKSNHLRDTIVKRLINVGGVPVVQVGSSDPIALLHHEGTVPHPIHARRAPLLVFWWDRIGATVYTRSVNHPGTKPNRYLTNALGVLRARY